MRIKRFRYSAPTVPFEQFCSLVTCWALLAFRSLVAVQFLKKFCSLENSPLCFTSSFALQWLLCPLIMFCSLVVIVSFKHVCSLVAAVPSNEFCSLATAVLSSFCYPAEAGQIFCSLEVAVL
ncbi:uncharacterized protein LOC128196788 [Vigna angularis]|uniref:uncharacterized protein LOC128196788 n=1 Tax=Phaseolus angularis TaxID=3914 RepID=UPI0022B2ED05|nr:uncharacterized protein LOC128196788 [Vigna angularis]